MGSWGTAIFQDDTACDVRDSYVEMASLGFDHAQIAAELQASYGEATGIDESTFAIALALTQHKLGRLDDATKARALQMIETGRALSDWAELTEPGDPSIRSRMRQLEKARSTLLSPQRPQKRLKPSPELQTRIDRTYVSYPWRVDGLYAYRTRGGVVVVFAATAVHDERLRPHYARTTNGYATVGRPVVRQALLLLLDYRGPDPPTPEQSATLQPLLKPATDDEWRSARKSVAAVRAVWEEGASEGFDTFEARSRALLSALDDERFRRRYEEYNSHCRTQLALYEDADAAARRYFYRRYMLDPKDPVPVDRLTDLGVDRTFVTENSSRLVNWSSLDDDLKA
jgi:hypothetical protein